MSKLEYCIDVVDIQDDKVIIKGWAYKHNLKSIKFNVLGDENASVSTEKRIDIYNKFNKEAGAEDAGFSITTINKNNINIVIECEDETVEVKVKPKEFNKKDVTAKLKKALKMMNINNLKKVINEVNSYGLKATYHKARNKFTAGMENNIEYDKWIRERFVTEDELERQRNHKFEYEPKISVIIPTYNTKINFLNKVVDSVRNQSYENWELCIADGASTSEETLKRLKEYEELDSRIKVEYLKENYMISGNTNEALKLVTGEYVALLDHDDILTEDVLYEYVKVLNEDRDVEFIYCDEDKIDEFELEYFDPHFKPDWAPDTFRNCNYICHFSMFSKDLLDRVGYFNSDFDGSQDYDIILRLTEQAKKVYHVPKVLYHWRVHRGSTAGGMGQKSYTIEAGRRALEAHLKRIGEEGKVEHGRFNGCYRVSYDIKENKKVSIIIPNKDEKKTLKTCIDSILTKTTYQNYEIVVVENNSTTTEIFDYYKEIEKNSRVKVVRWNGEFNYSAINNFGVKNSDGDYILLLNNDTEVISENWIEEMVMHAQKKEIGAVGAKLYYIDDTIQHFGVVLGVGGVAEHLGKGLGRYDGGHMGRLFMKINVMAVTGACLMMRRNVFDELGGLNEKLKVAYNDVDLCMKARKAGYLNLVTPYAELYHYESKSRGLDTDSEKMHRLQKEMNLFNSIWGENIIDPYYNVNFSKQRGDFKLAE